MERWWQQCQTTTGSGGESRPHGGVSALAVVVFFFAGFLTVLVWVLQKEVKKIEEKKV